MINTNCEKCIFSKLDQKECVFDIPDLIKEHKQISKKNNFNYIENYICRYTLSDDMHNDLISEGYTLQNILDFMIEKIKVRYYLVINISSDLDKIKDLCFMINKLEILPVFISFINKDLNNGNQITDLIQEHLSQKITWKLHNFLVDLDLQECMTISMDTNFTKTSSQIFCVYDQATNGNDYDLLNSRIIFLHISLIVNQINCHAVLDTISSLDGLAMSFNAYKLLINGCDKNILLAIDKESKKDSGFKYITYKYDK